MPRTLANIAQTYISSNERYKILIIEDEIDFLNALVEILNLEGFEVIGLTSIAEFREWKTLNHCDIILLDRKLPDGDGIDVLKECRANGISTPIIVLTGASTVANRVEGINYDADYYLVKPIITAELVALIHKFAKKISLLQQCDSVWNINSITWILKSPQGIQIKLTKNELKILSCFINQSGAVVPREKIIESLGENPGYYDLRRLEITLRRLRKKAITHGITNFPLTTIYAVGYAFNSPLIDDTLHPAS